MNALLKHRQPKHLPLFCSLLTDHSALFQPSSSPFQHLSVSDFQHFPMHSLNDIAITQMRTLISASSVKRLK
jgi:hypothetical protein